MNKISKEQQTEEKKVTTKEISLPIVNILELGITLEEMLLIKESVQAQDNKSHNDSLSSKEKTEIIKEKNLGQNTISIDDGSKDILDKIAKLPGKLLDAYSSGFKDGSFGRYTLVAFQQETFHHGLYDTPKLNYFDAFSSSNIHHSKNESDNEYSASLITPKEESENISPAQAQKTFMDINYAAAAGAYSSVSFKDRNRLDMWIKFNRALFHGLMEPNSITRDLDYSRMG